MTDDTRHPDESENHPDDQQQAVEASEHAVDALDNGDLAYARELLDEARAAVERAQHNESGQAQRETAYDCSE